MVACSSAFGFRTYRGCHSPCCYPPQSAEATTLNVTHLLGVRCFALLLCLQRPHLLSFSSRRAPPFSVLPPNLRARLASKKKKKKKAKDDKKKRYFRHNSFSPSLLGAGYAVSLQHIITGPVPHLSLPCDEFCRVQHSSFTFACLGLSQTGKISLRGTDFVQICTPLGALPRRYLSPAIFFFFLKFCFMEISA